MQVEIKISGLIPCLCGYQPDHYTIGYGSTPYDVSCPNCKKQTAHTKYKITNSYENLIHYWNNHVAKMTVEEVNTEIEDVKKERIIVDPDNEYIVYEYYWWSHHKPTLKTKCRS